MNRKCEHFFSKTFGSKTKNKSTTPLVTHYTDTDYIDTYR